MGNVAVTGNAAAVMPAVTIVSGTVDLQYYHDQHASNVVSMRKLANSVYCKPNAVKDLTKFQQFLDETGLEKEDLEKELQAIYAIYKEHNLIKIIRDDNGSVKGKIYPVCHLTFFLDLEPTHLLQRLINKIERCGQILVSKALSFEFSREQDLEDFILQQHARTIRDNILKALYEDVNGHSYCNYPNGFDPHIFKLEGEDDTFINNGRHFVMTDMDKVILDNDRTRIMYSSEIRNLLQLSLEAPRNPNIDIRVLQTMFYNFIYGEGAAYAEKIKTLPHFYILRRDSRTSKLQEKMTKYFLNLALNPEHSFDQGVMHTYTKKGVSYCELRTITYHNDEDNRSNPRVISFKTQMDLKTGMFEILPLNEKEFKYLNICPLTEFAKDPYIYRKVNETEIPDSNKIKLKIEDLE